MQHPMRRKLQALPIEACFDLLLNATGGVLSMVDSDNTPYAVPVNFVLYKGAIYIHGAPMGARSEIVKTNPKVSFCVIGQDVIVPEQLTSHFKSVIVKGTVNVVTDDQKKMDALMALSQKFSADYMDKAKEEAQAKLHYVEVIEIVIDEMVGKQATELM